MIFDVKSFKKRLSFDSKELDDLLIEIFMCGVRQSKNEFYDKLISILLNNVKNNLSIDIKIIYELLEITKSSEELLKYKIREEVNDR